MSLTIPIECNCPLIFSAWRSMVYSWILNLSKFSSMAIRFYFFDNRFNW